MKNPVPYRVECDFQDHGIWETIAAFNCTSAARHYATDCAEAKLNLPCSYRVTYRKRVLYDAAFIKGEAIIQAKLGKENG